LHSTQQVRFQTNSGYLTNAWPETIVSVGGQGSGLVVVEAEIELGSDPSSISARSGRQRSAWRNLLWKWF